MNDLEDGTREASISERAMEIMSDNPRVGYRYAEVLAKYQLKRKELGKRGEFGEEGKAIRKAERKELDRLAMEDYRAEDAHWESALHVDPAGWVVFGLCAAFGGLMAIENAIWLSCILFPLSVFWLLKVFPNE